eukprot:COSAG01_NODE_9623_length_2385_cov_4.412331_3_plen_97_part_00
MSLASSGTTATSKSCLVSSVCCFSHATPAPYHCTSDQAGCQTHRLLLSELRARSGSHLFRNPSLRAADDEELMQGWMAGKRHPLTGEPLRIDHLEW